MRWGYTKRGETSARPSPSAAQNECREAAYRYAMSMLWSGRSGLAVRSSGTRSGIRLITKDDGLCHQ